MKKTAIAFVLPMVLTGCGFEIGEGVDGEEQEAVGEAEQALLMLNALAPNALAPNALAPNALAPNALAPNALAPNALAPNALTSIRGLGAGGTYSRMLLQYVVGCALSSTQSFRFSWVDAQDTLHDETYWGIVGLAPEWVARAATPAEQRWVSACVAARTNYYGVTVMISMRGTHAVATADNAERAAYSVQEGAFWGNLFAPSPYIRSCYIPENVDYARAKQRDCAVGHLEGTTTVSCGMLERRGPCSTLCADRTVPAGVPDDGFQSCDGTAEVLSTYLASPSSP